MSDERMGLAGFARRVLSAFFHGAGGEGEEKLTQGAAYDRVVEARYSVEISGSVCWDSGTIATNSCGCSRPTDAASAC